LEGEPDLLSEGFATIALGLILCVDPNASPGCPMSVIDAIETDSPDDLPLGLQFNGKLVGAPSCPCFGRIHAMAYPRFRMLPSVGVGDECQPTGHAEIIQTIDQVLNILLPPVAKNQSLRFKFHGPG